MSSDPKPRKRFVIVGNATGGQGKTLVSHILAYLIRDKEPFFKVMCADTADMDAGSKVAVSKLGRMVTKTVELGAGPSPSDVQRNPDLAMAFWDKIGDTVLDDKSSVGCLMDVGANVVSSLLDWAEAGGVHRVLEGSVVVDFVVPCVASSKAIADALAVLTVFSRGKAFPVGRMFLVENAWQGGFESFAENADLVAAVRIVEASGGAVVRMPLCRSMLLRKMEEKHRFIGEVASWSYADVARVLELQAFKASREQGDFHEWLDGVRESFAASGMADPHPATSDADLGRSVHPV